MTSNSADFAEEGATDLQFRAVVARGKRRGIRLERIFWEALASAAAAEGRTVGDTVATTHDNISKGGNLSSALRVVGARWLRERLVLLERAVANENVVAILQACPSAAFVLAADKRIVHYNLPFLIFVQTSFVGVDQSEAMQGLSLSLDTPLETVIERLRAEPVTPVTTGFAVGVVGKCVRGEIKAVLTPTPDAAMIIGFITRH